LKIVVVNILIGAAVGARYVTRCQGPGLGPGCIESTLLLCPLAKINQIHLRMANVHTLNDSPRKPPDIDQSKNYSDRFVDVLAGDTFNGMISGGNVGGRDNNNTYNSGPGIIPINNDESLTQSISGEV